MDENDNILISSKSRKFKKTFPRIKNKKHLKKIKKKKAYLSPVVLLFVLILVFILFLLFFIIYKKLEKTKQINDKIDLESLHSIFSNSFQYEEFDENINKYYIKSQNYFCEKQNEVLIPKYEQKIKLANVNFEGKIFDLFVYNSSDVVGEFITKYHYWEKYLSIKVLKALDYYAKKKNLENKDIYLLDIGGNIGWYTYFLGSYGYKIISFEASEVNSYILYKNYCLNKDTNVTIINKGLDKEDKKCIIITRTDNQGNGMIFCENRENFYNNSNGETYNIELTRLSRYYKFLSDKNLAFIKMDVEGDEANVIEGGQELISKYHVPFIMMEFEEKMLNIHKTKGLEFLQFFEKNGYKISKEDFLSKQYISSEEIMQKKDKYNLFIVYEKILE